MANKKTVYVDARPKVNGTESIINLDNYMELYTKEGIDSVLAAASASGAENGLSVSDEKVVLGGILNRDTNIAQAGFDIVSTGGETKFQNGDGFKMYVGDQHVTVAGTPYIVPGAKMQIDHIAVDGNIYTAGVEDSSNAGTDMQSVMACFNPATTASKVVKVTTSEIDIKVSSGGSTTAGINVQDGKLKLYTKKSSTALDTATKGQVIRLVGDNGEVEFDTMPGLGATNFRLARELTLPYINENTQSVNIPEFDDATLGGSHGLIYIKEHNCLYSTVRSNVGASFIRFNNPEDLTDYTHVDVSSVVPGYNAPDQIIYSAYTDRIYMVVGDLSYTQSNLRVIEIHPTTNAFSLVIDEPLGAGQLTGGVTCTIIGNNLFTMNGYYNGKLMKFSLDSFTLTSTISITEANNSIHSIDTDGKKLYLASSFNSSDHSFLRVDPITMVLEQQATHNLGTFSGTVSGVTDDILIWGDYIYLPTEGLDSNKLLRVEKANLANVIELDIKLTNPGGATGIFTNGDSIYIGGPNYLSTYQPSTGDVTTYDTAKFPINQYNEIATDGSRLFMAGFNTYPVTGNGYVTRIMGLVDIKETFKIDTDF